MKGVLSLLILGAIIAGTLPAIAENPPAPAATEASGVSLDVKDVRPEIALRQIEPAIGAPVIIETREGVDWPSNSFTLRLSKLPPMQALEKIAAALGGRIQRRYEIMKAVEGELLLHGQPSGATATLEFKDLDIRVAARMVAKAAGGTVKVADDVSGKVSLNVTKVPVEDALDAICGAVGASWRISYVIVKAETKTAETPKTEEKKAPEKITKIETSQTYGEKAGSDNKEREARPGAEPGALFAPGNYMGGPGSISARMREGIETLFSLPLDQRRKEIQSLAERLDAMVSHLSEADPESRNRFYERMMPVFKEGSDLINGLPPERRQEMAPINEVLQRILHSVQPPPAGPEP